MTQPDPSSPSMVATNLKSFQVAYFTTSRLIAQTVAAAPTTRWQPAPCRTRRGTVSPPPRRWR